MPRIGQSPGGDPVRPPPVFHGKPPDRIPGAGPVTTAAGVLELLHAEANAPPVVPPTSGWRISPPRCRAVPGRPTPTNRPPPWATESDRAHPEARSPQPATLSEKADRAFGRGPRGP